MVKITFEVSEDFIRENASPKLATEKMKAAEGDNAVKVMFDLISFSQMENMIDKGKTEFIVTPDKLDETSMQLWETEIPEICLLGVFSESDKKEEGKPE